MTADADEGWISGEEAGELVGVDPATIWRAWKSGHIAAKSEGVGKRPRIRLYKRSDVEQWGRDRQAPQVTARMKQLEQRVTSLEEWRARMEQAGE
jgi:hypothetical protein